MSLAYNMVVNLYSILILTIIFIHATKSSEKNLLQEKIYMWMILVTAFMLIMDVLSRLDGYPDTAYAPLNQTGNFMVFLLSPAIPSLWLLYVQCQLDHQDGKMKRWRYILPTVNGIYTVMVVLSNYSGWFYTINSENIYQRGPLFFVPVAITAVLYAISFVLIILNRREVERKLLFSLVAFPIPPLICIVIQIFFYGISLILNGVALSLLIIFVTIQNRRMNTDYLTGVYNRKGLQIYLRQKIHESTENKSFSAILLDLDNFKMINDTFGHDIGDCVLVTFVKLLKGCIGSSDFIARFGGDEFYIILNSASEEELDATVNKIYECIRNYNAKDVKPLKLGVSMGYALYNYNSPLNVTDFQKYLDTLMYENKRANKENSLKYSNLRVL